uniref:Uncharacterized protein n=1 Tax=Bionectria ochroleuca TaxID=29856 RepID=A0A0B7K3D3_BIOOC
MPQSKKKENSKKKQENSESSGTAVTADASATSAASTNLTKPSTTASEIHPKEIHPKASEFVLPRFDFERHNPDAPKASFSSAALYKQLLKDEETMTIDELDKKYGWFKRGPTKGVPADKAMEILMEEIGSI